MSEPMRRREFVTFLGGAVAAWPVAARAQQPAMPVVGYLNTRSVEGDALYTAAFRQGLKEIGFVEGQNVAIVYRFANGKNDRIPAFATDLVRRQVNVIAAMTRSYSDGLDHDNPNCLQHLQ
jgi:putative ABC transport system substrate-binding protein